MDIPDDPDKFHEAIAEFRKRIPMGDAEFEALETAEKEFAFTVAGVAQADVVKQVYDAIGSAVENGDTLAEFKEEVGDALSLAWGGEEPWRLESLFRTNIMSAYNDGRHRIMNKPAVREARPYIRADVVDDDRTSDICEELIDVILPADDPFWDSHHPPLHHACRTILTPLSEEEASEEGVDTHRPDIEADEGFGEPPSDEDQGGEDWEPDLSEYPSAIGHELDRKLR